MNNKLCEINSAFIGDKCLFFSRTLDLVKLQNSFC